jgi:hypothetical protein
MLWFVTCSVTSVSYFLNAMDDSSIITGFRAREREGERERERWDFFCSTYDA